MVNFGQMSLKKKDAPKEEPESPISEKVIEGERVVWVRLPPKEITFMQMVKLVLPAFFIFVAVFLLGFFLAIICMQYKN